MSTPESTTSGPGTPTDQVWIESFFGHVKTERPNRLAIADPART